MGKVVRINLSFKKWSLAAAAALLAGCAVGPDYKAPEPTMPKQYSEIGSATRPTTGPAATEPEGTLQLKNWWTQFNDPELDRLISRAVRFNPDIISANERIREARGTRGIAESGLFPDIQADGSYTHTRESQNLPLISDFSSGGAALPGLTSDVYEAGFDASWEIDVFGGQRRQVEAANAYYQAAIEDRRDVQVSLCAEVASDYIALRGAQYELELAKQNLQSQQQTLALTRSKAEGGLIPYLNVDQQEAQVQTTAATIPTLETQIRQDIHRVSILCGVEPGTLSKELSLEAPIPVGPPNIPPGIPGDLLRRRPDIRRAERQLAAATANIGVATADLYPKFSITGALGDEAGSFKKLFDYNSRFYDIAPGVTWDIFNAGRVQSNIVVQNARQAEALQTYRKTVLQSMADVDDSLVAYNREQERLQSLRQAVTANQQSVQLSTELFSKGRSDFLTVLDAQRDLFAAQDAMARSQQQVSTDLISLYKALGGGWNSQ